jgi:zinc transport system substrate-binding protein
VPAGGDAHDVELSGAQVAELEAADVVLHVGGGLQPATDDALEIAPPGLLVDAAEVVELQAGDGAVDPHFWLDPRLLAEVAAAAAAAFAEADPDGAAGYRDRAAGLDDRLLALDDEITATLDGCDGALLVTSHEAFGYLTRRHGLEQVGLTGLDPQVPPSPARVRRVVDLLQDREVSTIFFERAAGPRLTRALAQDLDLRTAVLDPVERTPAAGEDYLSVMDDNREALAAGLVCGG